MVHVIQVHCRLQFVWLTTIQNVRETHSNNDFSFVFFYSICFLFHSHLYILWGSCRLHQIDQLRDNCNFIGEQKENNLQIRKNIGIHVFLAHLNMCVRKKIYITKITVQFGL